MALVLCIGALPFVIGAGAYAEENRSTADWLWEDYRKPVGLTYNAQAKIQTAYLWRGLYSGAANIQASANVGYGGLYLDMWWNIGVRDWRFNSFQPEVDFSLGFSRWGLNIYALFIHNFNTPFFDFNNYHDRGNRLELNLRYTLSPKVPLCIAWGTRIAAADGYLDENGNLIRAYSSYAEISYTQALPLGFSLYGALGITPWRSIYTRYRGNAGVVNIDIRLRKDWSLSEHCGLMLQGQLSINPTLLAANLSSAQWHPYAPSTQTVNTNLIVGVYLK